MPEQNPRNLCISDFSYHLPEERIAQFPKDKRDEAKLLIFRNGSIVRDSYFGLADHLPADCRLVFNDTRVMQARLLFQKATGAMIEIFLLEPEEALSGFDVSIGATGKTSWKCLVGGAGKWKTGQLMSMTRYKEGREIILQAAITGKTAKNFVVEFTWEPSALTFSELLQLAGNIPIPPYLRRNPDLTDKERYQTIYAAKEGSVAAPTAGLHFTGDLMTQLAKKNILATYLTLHVGAGTFLPVKSEQMEGHFMHGEFISVEREAMLEMISSIGKIFAVGTTSLRTMESLYWMGTKALRQPDINPGEIWIRQWEIYDELAQFDFSPAEALQGLLHWMEKNNLDRLVTKTEILIAPPYKPRTIMGLITNFHQPHSTLLLLVAAVIGDQWKKVYDYALDNDFRFLSYGDGCLLYAS